MNGFPSDDYDPDYFDKPPPLAERICVRDPTLITDFDEYTFRAPRAGLFAGDWVLPYPSINPIRQFRFHLDIRGSTSASPGGSAFLERLPRELLHQILSLLDPCSAVAFAGTSVVCRRAVLSLQCFEAVANCPRLLGTILYLRCRFFTFAQLASCISDTGCRQWNCRHYGDVLYLVTGYRLCYDHWRIGWTPAIVQSQLEEEALAADIPHICVLPGYYGSLGEGVCSQPRYAFDSYALAEKFDYRGKGVAYGSGNEPALMSFVAALQMPYYDELSDSWEEGHLCRACAAQGWDYTVKDPNARRPRGIGDPYPAWGLPNRRYTRAGMMAHIEEHGRVFRVTQADGSVRLAHEKPFPKWHGWNDHSYELMRMNEMLQALREKRFELPQMAAFLPSWYWVPTTPWVPRKEGCWRY